LKDVLGRLVRFGLVGGVATGIQYVILVVLVQAAGMWSPAASAIGFVISACGNYLLNYHFTFRSREDHRPAVAKFMVLAGVGLAINYGLMQWLTGMGWNYMVAQVCATLVVFLWNFTGNSLWTFRAYIGP
jgi:putative flippase GtrA